MLQLVTIKFYDEIIISLLHQKYLLNKINAVVNTDNSTLCEDNSLKEEGENSDPKQASY